MVKKAKKTVKKKAVLFNKENKPADSGEVKRTKIRVIGIGGGGGSIVSEIASKMKKASFVIANTDKQALKTASKKAIKFQFGQELTQGLGTGMNSELGREAAQQEKEKIKKLLEGHDLCILVACLGGGTGSGAAPVFSKISKDLGNLTYGIFTLPFKFEGEKKMELAKESLRQVKTHLNALSIIPNDRIFQIIDKTIPLKGALSAINKNLTESLEGLIETIYEPGLINIDFADFRTVLQGRGRLAYLNTLQASKKETSAKDLIIKTLNCPLYPYTIKGAKGVLFNIAGEKDLSLSDVNQVSKTIAELVNLEAKIIFGIAQAKKYSDLIKTTVLATGCGMKIFPTKKQVKKRKKPTQKKKVAPKEVKKERPKKEEPKKTIKKQSKRKKKIKVKTIKEKKNIAKKEELKEELPKEQEVRIRKNGLQIKEESKKEEEEMLAKEKFWEVPAFLRKKTENQE